MSFINRLFLIIYDFFNALKHIEENDNRSYSRALGVSLMIAALFYINYYLCLKQYFPHSTLTTIFLTSSLILATYFVVRFKSILANRARNNTPEWLCYLFIGLTLSLMLYNWIDLR
jgi:drug/metabolite transporter (DMT)-like permease